MNRDILHPGRANISKDELRDKLAGMYKASKDQVNVFGLRTQFGGGKTTGFALVYESPEAMKKFEPHYRLIRVGLGSKIEKPSRQQRTCNPYKCNPSFLRVVWCGRIENRQELTFCA
jgi:small subunit ribosomal protein S24e